MRKLPLRLRALCLFALACALLVSALGAEGQGQLPLAQFRGGIELMRLHVSVTRKGEHVAGLSADDFLLEVNDTGRPVELVVEVDLEALTPDGDRNATGKDTAWRRRHYMLFIDVAFQRKEKLEVVRKGALHFLRNVALPTDLVGLAAFGRRGVVLLAPFTEDHDRIEHQMLGLSSDWNWWVGRAQGGGFWGRPFLIDPLNAPLKASRPLGIRGGTELTPDLVPEHAPSYVDLVRLYWAGLRELAFGMQAIEGRKHLLLFSRAMQSRILGMSGMPEVPDRLTDTSPLEGLNDPYFNFDYTSRSLRAIAYAATEALRDADAAVYSLSTAPLGRFGLFVLWYLTDETGGFRQYHTHHLEKHVARIGSRTSRYYIIAYRRRPDDPDRVNVSVKVDRGGVNVLAPTRLALPPEPAAMSRLQRQLWAAQAKALR